MNKPFSKSLYDANDSIAKTWTTKLAEYDGCSVTKTTKELYRDGDVIITNPSGITKVLECEIRQNFDKLRKYSTLHMLARKASTKAEWIVDWSPDGNACYLINVQYALTCPTTIMTCQVEGQEIVDEVYDVPKIPNKIRLLEVCWDAGRERIISLKESTP